MCGEREADPGSDPAEVRVLGRQPRARHSRPRPRPPAPADAGPRSPHRPVASWAPGCQAHTLSPHGPRLPSRRPQERGRSAAAAPDPAGPAHPGAGGASGSSQSKSRAPRSARVRWRLWVRAPQAASQEEASIGLQLSPASSAPVSILPPPAQTEPGTSLPGLAFPPGQRGGEDAERLPARQASKTQDPPLLVQWEENQVPETRMRAPAGCSKALPNLRGVKNSGAERAPRRQLGPPLELCAGAARARGNRAVFARGPADLAGAVDDGCRAGWEGRSNEESPWSGRSGAVAARAPKTSCRPSPCLQWTPRLSRPQQPSVFAWLPAAWL